jgi:hypothetical protein
VCVYETRNLIRHNLLVVNYNMNRIPIVTLYYNEIISSNQLCFVLKHLLYYTRIFCTIGIPRKLGEHKLNMTTRYTGT